MGTTQKNRYAQKKIQKRFISPGEKKVYFRGKGRNAVALSRTMSVCNRVILWQEKRIKGGKQACVFVHFAGIEHGFARTAREGDSEMNT